MPRQPVSHLIFLDIVFHGHWILMLKGPPLVPPSRERGGGGGGGEMPMATHSILFSAEHLHN